MRASRTTIWVWSMGVGLGVALVVGSRAVLFANLHVAPDSDECVLGLMAKHILEGRDLPILFYGQGYGLSVLEAAIGAAFFGLFGVSVLSLKGGMLLLWGIGWLLLVLAVKRYAGTVAAWIAAVLLALCPAWAVWSTKARGGYLTAFVLTNLAIWLIARLNPNDARKAGTFAGVGVCLGLVFWSQPLWLAGAVPFVVFLTFRRVQAVEVIALVAGALAAAGLVFLATLTGGSGFWSPQIFVPHVFDALGRTPARLWTHLSGAYYYTEPLQAGLVTTASATLWCVAILVSAVTPFQRRGGGIDVSVARAGALAMFGVIACTLLIDYRLFCYRYLLPLSGFAIIVLSIELATLWTRGRRVRAAVGVTVTVVVFLAVGSFFQLRAFSSIALTPGGQVRDAEAMEQLVDDLLTENINHVYTRDGTLQWNIIFTSREAIKARWVSPVDRYPEYPQAVDRALRNGRPVAVVGDIAEMDRLNSSLRRAGYSELEARPIADQFFILPAPPVEILRGLRFRFDT